METQAMYPRLAEYGDVQRTNAPRSNVTCLDKAPGVRIHGQPTVSIWRGTAGYECAGSMMRWTDPFIAVWWNRDGARHGARYFDTPEGETKARTHFASLTTSA